MQFKIIPVKIWSVFFHTRFNSYLPLPDSFGHKFAKLRVLFLSYFLKNFWRKAFFLKYRTGIYIYCYLSSRHYANLSFCHSVILRFCYSVNLSQTLTLLITFTASARALIFHMNIPCDTCKVFLLYIYFFRNSIKEIYSTSYITLYFSNVSFQQNSQQITYSVSFTCGSRNYWSDFEIRWTFNTNI